MKQYQRVIYFEITTSSSKDSIKKNLEFIKEQTAEADELLDNRIKISTLFLPTTGKARVEVITFGI